MADIAGARAPWNPQSIADDVLHAHLPEPDRGVMIFAEEADVVSAMALDYDRVDGVWVDGHGGPQALLWPMKLGRSDQA